MDPSKIKEVADWPVPRNSMEICQFLGFTGYYQYFITNYSKIAQPLLDLTKKSINWEWNELQMFEKLKTCMCAHPVLAQLNFDKQFYLQTDALDYGMGAVLLQKGEATAITSLTLQKTKLHPITYYSATFLPAERDYNIYKRELLAMMKPLAHW